MSYNVNDLLDRYSRLKSRRSSWNTIYNMIARRCDPKNASFYDEAYQPDSVDQGTKRFDSTVTLAAPKWAAAIDSLTTPRNEIWHSITTTDERINEKYKTWLESVTNTLFRLRYAASSNFSNANSNALLTECFYGSAPFRVTRNAAGNGISYACEPLREFYVDTDHENKIDTFVKHIDFTTRQAIQHFGDSTPEAIKSCGDIYKTWEFIQMIFPNDDYRSRSANPREKRFASVYISVDEKKIISVGGMEILPFIWQRYDVLPSTLEAYGYSPVMLVMPEVRTLNSMTFSNLQTGDRMSNPTLLTTEDDILAQSYFANGTIVPGGLDANGNQRARVLDLPGQLPFSVEMIKSFQDVIRQALNLDLFQIIVNKPDMTATEVLQRAAEKASLLAPFTSRRECEFLSPLVQKELEIAFEIGEIKDIPDEVREAMMTGSAKFSINYDSPIRRAQKAESGMAMVRVLQMTSALSAFSNVKNEINGHRTISKYRDIMGAPADMLNTDEERAAADEADAQAQQTQQMLAAAPVISDTAKTLSGIQSSGGLLGGGL